MAVILSTHTQPSMQSNVPSMPGSFITDEQLTDAIENLSDSLGAAAKTNDYNDLDNTPENLSDFENDTQFISESDFHSAMDEKQDIIDDENKISSSLVDDSDSDNKFVSDEEKESWSAKSNFNGRYYSDLKRLDKYKYTAEYNSIDYDYAYEYFLTKKPVPVPKCSSFRNGRYYGRNLDWTYDDGVTVSVKVPRINGRYASIGTVSGMPGLTSEFIESGEQSDLYRVLPFCIVDGMNEYGVVVNTNVVPLDNDPTTETIPTVSKDLTMCAAMIPRFIIDNFDNATDAVDYIREHVAVFISSTLQAMLYEMHFMVADNAKTYCIEFIDNETVILDITDKPYMTNFYLSGVTFNDDGTVYTPSTQDDEHNAMVTNGITQYGSGLERYNILVNGAPDVYSVNSAEDLLEEIYFTKAYTPSNERYTEFVGINGLTCASTPSSFAQTVLNSFILYSNRSRDPSSDYFGTWQSTHSVVYDMDEKTVYLATQESGVFDEYILDIPVYKSELQASLNGKQDSLLTQRNYTPDQKSTIRNNIGAVDISYVANEVNALSQVSRTGSYYSLLDYPTKLSQFQNNAGLATEAFVNSSIATNTAFFRGTFNSVQELNAYDGEITNNDYAFVVVYDPNNTSEVLQYDRYKYSDDTKQFTYEYTLNNSSFTAAQWGSIQSGITSEDVLQIQTNKQDIAEIKSELLGIDELLGSGVIE